MTTVKSTKTKTAVLQFINSRRAKGLSKATVSWYGRMMKLFYGMCPELPTKALPIENFMSALNCSDESRHAYYRTLRAFYYWFYPRHNPANPMLDIGAPKRRKKVPYSLSMAEIGYLLAAPLTTRDRALIELLLDTGVRIGEALGLHKEDVLDETIMVDGKTGQRQVPISESVREELLALPGQGYIFTGLKGPLTNSGGYRIIKMALKRAGIHAKKAGPHTLRHTFGRQYIMAGGDLVSLQRILGHSDIATTRIYAELDLRDITVQHAKFSPLTTLAAAMHRPELKVDVSFVKDRLKN